MACQCGCSTAEPRADLDQSAGCECGCATPGAPEGLDSKALERLVLELDQRVRELETATARS